MHSWYFIELAGWLSIQSVTSASVRFKVHNMVPHALPEQAMLAMDDTGALLRFVQRPNRASLPEGEAALKAAGRYSELVALYQARGRHQQALELLRTLALVCHTA